MEPNMKVYSKPLYYEIAFDFVDIKKQVKLFESFIEKYSRIPVKRFLDIGCGPSKQLIELAEQNYQSVGLDLSNEMLKYLKVVAKDKGLNIATVKANFVNFILSKKVDFACMLMGTISYIDSNQSFTKHLNSVALNLNKGGLYLIENVIIDWSNSKMFKPQNWTMKQGGITVKTTFKTTPKDTLRQTVTANLNLEVKDKGKKISLPSSYTSKVIFPEEIKELVDNQGQFELIGWFERYSTKTLKSAVPDNILLLRRK